ncbi:hypothetical protein OV203_29395 [Nannocystis sp. ILAH1]|uniref:hypothetical protein n=1 Tax=Nannocystis sp. ILAH1 TaxID=2996789 RepID=UPI00226D5BA3|nr:hypothetical protein [Nannocystis sp. ILAH1]MCY0991298.1 hypothetical protein [Nannocystis sp. ILAH1]
MQRSWHVHRSFTALALGGALMFGCGDDGGATEGATTSTSTTEGATTDGPTTTATTTTTGTTEPTTGAPTSGETSDSTTGSETDSRVADCLRINACEADGGTPMGLQACLAHALDVPWKWASTGSMLLSIEAMNCKLAAPDCETVRACTPPAEAHAGACMEKPGESLCVGDEWVLCDFEGGPIAAMDCAAAGQQCGTQIWAGCGLETCEYGVTESTCDPDDPGVLIECNPDGFLERVDCRTQNNFVFINGMDGEKRFTIAGETCGFDPMRNANACIGTGEPCDFFSQECDGDVLETCAGGKLSRRDCSMVEPLGQGCGYLQSGPFAGGASCGLVNTQCALDAPESCDGATISFCDWDQQGTIDCVAEGYSGCATADYAGRTVAYCTP